MQDHRQVAGEPQAELEKKRAELLRKLVVAQQDKIDAAEGVVKEAATTVYKKLQSEAAGIERKIAASRQRKDLKSLDLDTEVAETLAILDQLHVFLEQVPERRLRETFTNLGVRLTIRFDRPGAWTPQERTGRRRNALCWRRARSASSHRHRWAVGPEGFFRQGCTSPNVAQLIVQHVLTRQPTCARGSRWSRFRAMRDIPGSRSRGTTTSPSGSENAAIEPSVRCAKPPTSQTPPSPDLKVGAFRKWSA